MKFLGFLLAFSLLPFSREEVHEFHISKCMVEYAPEQESLQIMLHVFLDDFELALAGEAGKELKLCTEKEKKGAEELLIEYLKKSLSFTINGEKKQYLYIGKEPSEDLLGVWIYLEIESLKNIQQLEIFNSLLTELFDDQSNLVQIRVPGTAPGMLMMGKDKVQESISF